MKRKREALTLWDAAFVKGSGTLKHWIDKVDMFEMSCNDSSMTSKTHFSDLADLELKSKTLKSKKKTMCAFSVGIRPSRRQKKVLNEMLKVSNYA